MPELSSNHEQRRPNSRNRLLRAKIYSLPSPATNRRRVGDASASGKTESSGWHRCCRYLEAVFVLHGDAVPIPLGFIALGQQWLACDPDPLLHAASRWSAPNGNPSCEEGRILPAPPLPQLSRRSGRVPAEPCPPLSCQSVSPNHLRTSRNIQRTASV